MKSSKTPYKYSLIIRGDLGKRITFTKKLEELGYIKYNCNIYSVTNTINTILVVNQDKENKSVMQNGYYEAISFTDFIRDFSFDIDNEWEYNAALAIAAIREGKELYAGEMCYWSGSNPQFVTLIGKEGDGGEGCWTTVETYNTLHKRYLRKATPEEIINYYKTQPDKEYDGLVIETSSGYRCTITSSENNEIGEYVLVAEGGSRHEGYTSSLIKENLRSGSWVIVDPDNKQPERKIIGYKSPIGLFGGIIKKGTIYSKTKDYNNIYFPIDTGYKNVIGAGIPREIAETWEPIYEQESKTFIVGSKNVEVTIREGKIIVRNEIFNRKKIEELYNYYTHTSLLNRFIGDRIIGAWSVKIDKDIQCIRIGCKEDNNLFSLNEIKKILDASL